MWRSCISCLSSYSAVDVLFEEILWVYVANENPVVLGPRVTCCVDGWLYWPAAEFDWCCGLLLDGEDREAFNACSLLLLWMYFKCVVCCCCCGCTSNAFSAVAVDVLSVRCRRLLLCVPVRVVSCSVGLLTILPVAVVPVGKVDVIINISIA